MNRALDTRHAAAQRDDLTKRPPVEEGVSLCSDVTPASRRAFDHMAAAARAFHAENPGVHLATTLIVREDPAP